MSLIRRLRRPLTRASAILALVLAGTAGLSVQTALAADEAPAARPPADPLASARALIADNKWAAAIAALKDVNNPGSADWNNLMGYSHRKARTPDLAAAERYYDAALRIDARHRGALEYSGELYLMMGQLEKAEQRLDALARACNATCPEHKDLHDAISRYKANGNKHVARTW